MTTIPTDSRFLDQWYLNNTSQLDGQPALDINVIDVWDNYTGKGVKIGIFDDGFDYKHPDLAANYNLIGDRDYVTGDYEALPKSADDIHGTPVAGIIGAAANETGTVGIAHNSTLTGFRVLGSSSTNMIAALNRYQDFDVVNNSWAAQPQSDTDYSIFFRDDFFNGSQSNSFNEAIVAGVKEGRDGLGTAIVFAAGNNRAMGDNTNYHNFQNSPYVITVGAVNENGIVSSYSNPGASILVSAFGSSGTIVTTDRQVGGYDNLSDYVNTFDGTSAAAPMVSGTVALMLEANLNLGYRDIQEILAYSARGVAINSSEWSVNGANNWNGGGLHVSHNHGFGLIDARAAVRLAENWQQQRTFQNQQQIVLDGGTNRQIEIDRSLDIDSVEVELDITHSYRGDLVVTLVSPDRTSSVLIDRPGNSQDSSSDVIFRTSSTHFRGENSTGVWTLKAEDTNPKNGQSGYINDWNLIVTGDAQTNNDDYIYTDEFTNYKNSSGRKTLIDSAGVDTLNASAVTSSSILNLSPGGVNLIATNSVNIDDSTLIEHGLGGDGKDLISGNGADNNLKGNRNNDTLYGYGGNDNLWGGDGNDSLTGGNGDDILDGYLARQDKIDQASEYDVLTGGIGADIFSLGVNSESYGKEIYYRGEGYADITDFNLTQGDKIKLLGSIKDYSIKTVNTNAVLSYQGDAIASIADVGNIASEILNESNIIFV